MHVDVFQIKTKLEVSGFNFITDLGQRLNDLRAFVITDQSHPGQHPGMGL